MLKKYFSKVSNIRSKKSNSPFDLIDFGTFLDSNEINGVAAYQNNVVVYRSVNLIAQAASHVPWLVLDNKSGKSRLIHNHPIYKLLITLALKCWNYNAV